MFVNEIKLYKPRKLFLKKIYKPRKLFLKIFPRPLATPCFCCSKGAEEGKHSKIVTKNPLPFLQDSSVSISTVSFGHA